MTHEDETRNFLGDPVNDDLDEDYEIDPESDCLICEGDGVEENDDPIQRGDSEWLKCCSCNGTGKRKDMTIW